MQALLAIEQPLGLADALGELGYEVAEFESLDELVASAVDESCSVVVVNDDSPDWLRLVSDLRRDRPDVSVVLIASLDGADEFLAAVAAGVDGFCAGDASVDAMIRTIRSVESSGVAIPRDMVRPLVDHVRHGRGRTVHTAAGPIEVTEREWDVLNLLLQRRRTREMADELFVSVGTVRSHISTLLKKIGAVDREDAIRLIERGERGERSA